MSGLASRDEKELLRPGAKCIIKISEDNVSASYWWGTVRNHLPDDEFSDAEIGSFFIVEAEISGGRFASDRFAGRHIISEERKGEIPVGDYTVYSDVGSTRIILWGLIRAKEKLQKVEAENKRLLGVLTKHSAQIDRLCENFQQKLNRG
jgi:hypothetical protein